VRTSIPALSAPKGAQFGFAPGEGPEFSVLLLGESTVTGLGVETMEKSLSAHYARNLSRRLGRKIHWQNYAQSGITARKLYHKLQTDPCTGSYDLIIICLGGNDAFSLHSPNRWKKDCLALIGEIKKHHQGPILFSDVPPIKDFPAFTTFMQLVLGNLVRLYRWSLQEIVSQETNVYLVTIPLAIHVRPGKTVHDNFSDGVHPSEITYIDWADDLAVTTEQIIKQNSVPFASQFS